MSTKRTIVLKDYTNILEEYEIAEALYPGHLLEFKSDGTVQKHSTAGGNVAPVMVPIEDALQGKTISDAYADGDMARVWVPRAGDEAYLILADNQDVGIGDLLESNGDGTLRKYAADSTGVYYSRNLVCVALEAVDTTGSPAATTSRISVKFV